MENIESVRLRRLHGRLGEVAYQLTKVQFSRFSAPESWQPAVNAYRCAECIVICVDLAGVDRKQISLELQGKRLMIRGQRQPPEPEAAAHKPVQVLAMEIDYGPFQREILLPSEVQAERISAEQGNGLLWIYLPLRAQA